MKPIKKNMERSQEFEDRAREVAACKEGFLSGGIEEELAELGMVLTSKGYPRYVASPEALEFGTLFDIIASEKFDAVTVRDFLMKCEVGTHVQVRSARQQLKTGYPWKALGDVKVRRKKRFGKLSNGQLAQTVRSVGWSPEGLVLYSNPLTIKELLGELD